MNEKELLYIEEIKIHIDKRLDSFYNKVISLIKDLAKKNGLKDKEQILLNDMKSRIIELEDAFF